MNGKAGIWARTRSLRAPAVLLSLLVVLLALSCALVPDLLAPHDPMAQSLVRRLRPPGFTSGGMTFPLGTDQLGRDVLSRIIHGARVTLVISTSAVAVAALVGTLAGLVGGYLGGVTDAILLRLVDMQLAFPVILLVIAVVGAVGASMPALVLTMGLSSWPGFARIVRSAVISVRETEFVEAARAVGATPMRIILRHVAPNVASATLVFVTFELSRMILVEATLSFLGIGVQPPTPSWGGMISEGQKYLSLSWTASFFPGLAIAATILAINMLGDLLRDALDPRDAEGF